MNEDQQELTYPEIPGHTAGSDTSFAAARSMDSASKTLQDDCLQAFGYKGPSTADEIATYLGKTVLAIRPRVAELRRLGLIQDTGERRTNESGRRAAVWRIGPNR